MQTAYIYDDVPRCASQFTGKERDTETGLDNFGARYHASTMGRFMSPDPFNPLAQSRSKFEAWISNPQRWNKYAYALNNPLVYIDPDGMNACGTNDDKNCKVTVTLTDRTKDKNGNYNDQWSKTKGNGNYNATATVSVNGKVVGTYLARTVPSGGQYPAIKNGTYEGIFWNKGGDPNKPSIKLLNGSSDHIPTIGPNSKHNGESWSNGILIHKAGVVNDATPLGYTGMTRSGTGVSEGCQLVCSRDYGGFLHDTGIRPGDGSAPQRHFTVVVNTEENDEE